MTAVVLGDLRKHSSNRWHHHAKRPKPRSREAKRLSGDEFYCWMLHCSVDAVDKKVQHKTASRTFTNDPSEGTFEVRDIPTAPKNSLSDKSKCINLYCCSCCKCGRSSHASSGGAPMKQIRALADASTDRLSSLLVMSIARNCSLVAVQRH